MFKFILQILKLHLKNILGFSIDNTLGMCLKRDHFASEDGEKGNLNEEI